MKSLVHPEVNIRMLVLDICEVTRKQENVILNTLYERFNDNYINRRNAEPIYLRFDDYRLPPPWATGYVSSLALEVGDKNKIEWSHPVDMVLNGYNGQVETSIPFEKFNLLLQDIYLLLPKAILDIEELGLLDKWRHGVEYDINRIVNTRGDATSGSSINKIDSRVKSILAVISDLGFPPMDIYTGGKKEIKNECLKDTTLFTEATFISAWKEARRREVVKMADHERFISL